MFHSSLKLLLVPKQCQTPLIFEVASFHTSSLAEGRIKRIARHKPYWHIKKLNKAEDEPLTKENKEFLQEQLASQYKGPLRRDLAPWTKGEWSPWARRCGVIGVKIGVHPLWLKNGKQIMTTLLHVKDNHVIRYNTNADYDSTVVGEKATRLSFPGYPARHPSLTGVQVVGALSTDPQRYTKDYMGLFTEAGVMPKRFLCRFPVTENAILRPGTELTASHFTIGQNVDVLGRTIERGFQGGMKKWGFRGMPATHGVTKSHRRIGCIGSGRDKSRVWPGQKMPGNVGGRPIWQCGLTVWRINHKESVLYVSGVSVPGNTGDCVQICDTRVPGKRWEALGHGPTRFPTHIDEEVPEEEWHPLVHQFNEDTIAYA